MGNNVFNALSNLRNNIFGPNKIGVTGAPSSFPPARTPIELAGDQGPLESLNRDPFSSRFLSYPSNLINDVSVGHYILFFMNVQNKTKYRYTDPFGKKVGGDTFKTTINKETGEYSVERSKGVGADLQDKLALRKLREGYSNNDEVATLHKSKQKRATGLSSVLPTTTRISDSVALYLPPNVQDSTSAG